MILIVKGTIDLKTFNIVINEFFILINFWKVIKRSETIFYLDSKYMKSKFDLLTRYIAFI